MKHTKQITTLLATAIIASLCQPTIDTSAASIKLSKSKIKLTQGKTTTLKVKGTKTKAKWSIKSGKKCIKLLKKRKASVKIKALKAGTARVQCKIGKKKLVCKVMVKAKTIKPKATPQTSLQPTVAPTNSPAQTSEPTGLPIRTHAPTEDRLMVEPAKSIISMGTNENGDVFVPIGGYERYYFFGSDIQRTKIEQVRFADKIEPSADTLGMLDLSERQNGSVVAWYTDQDLDNRYEMVIAQEGGVVANPDSSYLLCDVGWVTGLEHLYTSDVTDMSYMFYCFGYMCPFQYQENIYLDLGDNFDTSNVKNMDSMFREFVPNYFATLRLGKAFNIDKITTAILAFGRSEGGVFDIIVTGEKMRDWITRPENHCIVQGDEDRVILETEQ